MVWTSPESGQHVQTCRPDFLIWTGVYLDLDRIWIKSGPNLDQIWNQAKTVWTNFGNHPIIAKNILTSELRNYIISQWHIAKPWRFSQLLTQGWLRCHCNKDPSLPDPHSLSMLFHGRSTSNRIANCPMMNEATSNKMMRHRWSCKRVATAAAGITTLVGSGGGCPCCSSPHVVAAFGAPPTTSLASLAFISLLLLITTTV